MIGPLFLGSDLLAAIFEIESSLWLIAKKSKNTLLRALRPCEVDGCTSVRSGSTISHTTIEKFRQFLRSECAEPTAHSNLLVWILPPIQSQLEARLLPWVFPRVGRTFSASIDP
jgi:hypothetical protein